MATDVLAGPAGGGVHCDQETTAVDDWWEIHEEMNRSCEACVEPPDPCEVCGIGLVHSQFNEELRVELRCDHCEMKE